MESSGLAFAVSSPVEEWRLAEAKSRSRIHLEKEIGEREIDLGRQTGEYKANEIEEVVDRALSPASAQVSAWKRSRARRPRAVLRGPQNVSEHCGQDRGLKRGSNEIHFGGPKGRVGGRPEAGPLAHRLYLVRFLMAGILGNHRHNFVCSPEQ